MAWTSSLNCLSCRNPYQAPIHWIASPLFTDKPFFFTENCFVASPSQKSALKDGMKQQEIRRNKGKQTKKLRKKQPKIQKQPRFCGCLNKMPILNYRTVHIFFWFLPFQGPPSEVTAERIDSHPTIWNNYHPGRNDYKIIPWNNHFWYIFVIFF